MSRNFGRSGFVAIVMLLSVIAGLCILMGQGQMDEVHQLPLVESQIEKLELPSSAERLLRNNGTASELLLHSTSNTDEELKSISWFFSFIDERLRVDGIARQSMSDYWVLRSKTKPNSRHIYIPINLDLDVQCEVRSDKKPQNQMGQAARLVLRFLRGAYDDFDLSRRPFGFSGTRATEYADFSQPPARKLIDDWGDSFVFYTSLGGDALLVTEKGTVAWYQLETNQIVPVGTFEDAVKRYIEFSLDDREFCSWTDIPNRTKGERR